MQTSYRGFKAKEITLSDGQRDGLKEVLDGWIEAIIYAIEQTGTEEGFEEGFEFNIKYLSEEIREELRDVVEQFIPEVVDACKRRIMEENDLSKTPLGPLVVHNMPIEVELDSEGNVIQEGLIRDIKERANNYQHRTYAQYILEGIMASVYDDVARSYNSERNAIFMRKQTDDELTDDELEVAGSFMHMHPTPNIVTALENEPHSVTRFTDTVGLANSLSESERNGLVTKKRAPKTPPLSPTLIIDGESENGEKVEMAGYFYDIDEKASDPRALIAYYDALGANSVDVDVQPGTYVMWGEGHHAVRHQATTGSPNKGDRVFVDCEAEDRDRERSWFQKVNRSIDNLRMAR